MEIPCYAMLLSRGGSKVMKRVGVFPTLFGPLFFGCLYRHRKW